MSACQHGGPAGGRGCGDCDPPGGAAAWLVVFLAAYLVVAVLVWRLL